MNPCEPEAGQIGVRTMVSLPKMGASELLFKEHSGLEGSQG